MAREQGTRLAEVPRERMEELWEEAKGKEFTVRSLQLPVSEKRKEKR